MNIFINRDELIRLGKDLYSISDETLAIDHAVVEASEMFRKDWVGKSRTPYEEVMRRITSSLLVTQNKLVDSDKLLVSICREREQIDSNSAKAAKK